MAHGPRKQAIRFYWIPNHVPLGLRSLDLGYGQEEAPPYSGVFFNNNFATSVTLAEVCALLSTILVIINITIIIIIDSVVVR